MVIIEPHFVSEKLWAEVLGYPTEGLSHRWPKMGVGFEAVYDWMSRRRSIDNVPWRLPTSAEWEEDFDNAPFAHSIFGMTMSKSPEMGLHIFRGGGEQRKGELTAKILYDVYPQYTNGTEIGFRCARYVRREFV